jgi:inosine-uridine nucleoside N-ribohydrolase
VCSSGQGGWIERPAEGLPDSGPEKDFNVQWDTRAAEIVAGQADLTLVPLPVTLKASLCARQLPRPRASGPLGELLAEQSEARCADAGMKELGRTHRGLPDDLVNFHYDPLTCAVALGWQGAAIETLLLRGVSETYGLRFKPDAEGRPTQVVVDVDGEAFAETWIEPVEAAQSPR